MITDYYEPDVIEVTDTETNLAGLIGEAKACYYDDSGLWGGDTGTIQVRDRLKVLDAIIARIKSGIDDAEYIPGFVSRVEIQSDLGIWRDLLAEERVAATAEIQERGESLG